MAATVSGSHVRSGLHPTSLARHLAVIFEFDDAGKIEKIWNEWDLFSMWTQVRLFIASLFTMGGE